MLFLGFVLFIIGTMFASGSRNNADSNGFGCLSVITFTVLSLALFSAPIGPILLALAAIIIAANNKT